VLFFFLEKLNLIYIFLVIFLLTIQLKEEITKTKKRQLLQFVKIFIAIVLILYIFVSFLKTIATYFSWKNNPLSKHLLPPDTSLVYFLGYSFLHYFFSPLINVIFSFLVFFGLKKFNQKFEETFLYDEEPYLASFSILITGWPNCLIYLILILSLGVIFHLFHYLREGLTYLFNRSHQSPNGLGPSQEQDHQDEIQRLQAAGARRPWSYKTNKSIRLSLLYFWLPCALLVLLLNDIISQWAVIQYFKVVG